MLLLASALMSLIQLGSCRDLIFPEGFKFGAATSSYQVEGAWNVSDKGESIWDHYTHYHPDRIRDGATGDVACDSYHQSRKDVAAAKELGVDFYRFSINWARLLPNGVPNKISEDGKSFYNNLIDELLANDIEPVITVYHFELPQRFQNLGGWANPLIVEWFTDYARTVFSLFGDRVKTWITINEPMILCDFSYNNGIIAPGLIDFDYANYICSKNVLLAHAKAWRVYDEEFKPKFGGRVSVAHQLVGLEPATREDEYAAEIARQYYADRLTHPIFSKEGGWPRDLELNIAENSKKEGHLRSRLPALSQEEIDLIKGTYDYFALNYYTSRVARKPRPGETVSNLLLQGIPELGVVIEANPDWPPNKDGHWLLVYPEGLRQQLNWVKHHYGDIEIVIMENGYSSTSSELEDEERVAYYESHLEQVLLAIEEDKLNITGYTAWTLIDNFEWMDGYRTKFGLYEVDFSNPAKPRTPRKSAKFYAQVIGQNKKNAKTEL